MQYDGRKNVTQHMETIKNFVLYSFMHMWKN